MSYARFTLPPRHNCRVLSRRWCELSIRNTILSADTSNNKETGLKAMTAMVTDMRTKLTLTVKTRKETIAQ